LTKVEGGLRCQNRDERFLPGKPVISIVTVVLNGENYLEETIQSVLDQTYENVEYIIIDGGSKDDTINIIRKYENKISYWMSEQDSGLYDGLSKGLLLARGSIIGYCNAGDYYHKAALGLVSELFTGNGIHWLTGKRVNYNDHSQIIHIDTPNVYRKEFIRSGVYGSFMPYIQQESTFWSREALDTLDWDYFRSLRLAGDYYLWFSFSQKYNLNIVDSYLGGFKYHDNQLSTALDKYKIERKKFIKKMNPIYMPLLLWDMITWFFPASFKKKLNSKYFFTYNKYNKRWE